VGSKLKRVTASTVGVYRSARARVWRSRIGRANGTPPVGWPTHGLSCGRSAGVRIGGFIRNAEESQGEINQRLLKRLEQLEQEVSELRKTALPQVKIDPEYNAVRLEAPLGDDPYGTAGETLDSWLSGNVLVFDEKPSIYVYEHIHRSETFEQNSNTCESLLTNLLALRSIRHRHNFV